MGIQYHHQRRQYRHQEHQKDQYHQLFMNIIEKAEKDSNDLAKIESEKKQFDALQLWTAKPRYREPETLWQRIQRSYREWRNDICPIHKIKKTEHGFKGQVDCPECRREYYKRHYTVEAMKE